MTQDAVSYRIDAGIAYVCLNRPAVHNALSPASVRALSRAWQAIALDRTVKVVIRHASGDSFCSGRDLRETDLGFGPRARGRARAAGRRMVQPRRRGAPYPLRAASDAAQAGDRRGAGAGIGGRA